jgi:Carboxylesterase type B
MLASIVGFLAIWGVAYAAPKRSAPTAAVRNGTYTGVYSAGYDQDFFLGMPYAQQPVGNLRFTVPQSLNETWSGARDAREYSDICVGYGVSISKFTYR